MNGAESQAIAILRIHGNNWHVLWSDILQQASAAGLVLGVVERVLPRGSGEFRLFEDESEKDGRGSSPEGSLVLGHCVISSPDSARVDAFMCYIRIIKECC